MFKKFKNIINKLKNDYENEKNKNYIRKDELIENTKDFLKFFILNDKKARKEFKKRKKGKTYEQYIGTIFEKEKWQVLYNGIHKGKEDNKIDLIAIKNKEILFIQCKNWNTNKYKINLPYIKKFMYNSIKWLEDNKIKKFTGKCLIIMNKPLLDKESYKYIINNKFIDYKIIPFSQNNN